MQMHRFRHCLFFVVMVFYSCLAAGALCAGQVVTDDLRLWARDAVARESALDTQAASNTVGILYFDNQTRRTELDPLQKGLALMLITDLGKIDTIQVVERSRMQALVAELNLSTSGLVDSATAPRVGRLVGAAYLIGGRLLPETQAGIRIDSDLLRVARQDTLGKPSSIGSFEELMRMEKEIAFEIVRLLGLELTPAQVQELKKPLTTDLKALMFWFQGINHSDRQDYQQAGAAYEKALQTDPSFKPAAAAIDELRNLKLIAGPPANRELLERLRQRVSVNNGPEPDEIFKRDRSSGEVQTSDVTVRWNDGSGSIGR